MNGTIHIVYKGLGFSKYIDPLKINKKYSNNSTEKCIKVMNRNFIWKDT